MKITLKELKEAIVEVVKSIDFRQYHDPEGKQSYLGSADWSDIHGPLDDLDNILHFLDKRAQSRTEAGDRTMARKMIAAGDAIEQGNLKLAEKLLMAIYNTGGENESVYHAIAYVRDEMEDM